MFSCKNQWLEKTAVTCVLQKLLSSEHIITIHFVVKDKNVGKLHWTKTIQPFSYLLIPKTICMRFKKNYVKRKVKE